MKRIFHAAIVVLGLLLVPSYAQTETISKQKYPRDGKIRLYVYHIDTFAELDYLDANGEWDDAVYQKIIFLLRSYTDNKTIAIDKRLIELADHLQDHFGVDTVEVISAYRSAEYNDQLLKTGHNVAKESHHTRGMALDMHFDEIDEAAVRDYLLGLRLGGVGYYGKNLFVHADFGNRDNAWTDSEFVSNTAIGVFNSASSLRLRTARFYYGADDTVILAGFPKDATIQQLQVEHFFRGQWDSICRSGDQDCAQMLGGSSQNGQMRYTAQNLLDQNQNRFGKYRIRFEGGGSWQNSNEFYIKK